MVTRTAYDDLGRVTKITATEVDGGTGTPDDANLDTETTYDALGRTSTVLDPTNTVTRYDYDRLGRLTATWANYVNGTETDGATVDDDVHSTFAYDAAGELIRYCPAKEVLLSCNVAFGAEDQAWHYAFDDAGHLATQTPPDNQVATDLARRFWTYDPGGRLTNVCDDQATTCSGSTGTDGRHSVPTYDAVGRVTQLDTYTTATGSTLALRTHTTYLGDGQVTKTEAYENSGATLIDTIDATYDGLGRPDQLKRSTTVLADFGWNADGTLASRADGDAGAIGTTTFAYDWADRLVSANLPDGFSTAVPTFAWRADGLIKSRTFDTGSAVSFSYDRAKRPTTIAKGTLSLGQAYDRDGNVTSESRSLGFSGDAGSGTQSFTYDGLNRVLSSSGLGTGHTFTYEYDHDGNRTLKDDGSTTWTYGYDRTDQLSSVNGGPTVVGYNQFGDMTSKPEDNGGSTAWTYDYGGKLTSINGPNSGDDASFTFDALGRFKTRVLAASTDTYSYLGTTETVIRIDSTVSGADIDSIITSAGDRLGIDGASTMNWLLPDPHGSVAASLSADESQVTNAIRYDAWGDTLVTGGAGGAVGADAWKYQGRLDVSPSGLGEPLYDMSARFYAPSLGEFTQLDSVLGSAQNPLSMNRFLYAAANPATLIDPTGHWFGIDDAIAAGVGALFGGAATAAGDLLSGEGIRADHIVAGAVGGAAFGETLLYTANPIAAGAVGGAATEVTQQAWDYVATDGRSGFDGGRVVEASVEGAALGKLGQVAGRALGAVGRRAGAAAASRLAAVSGLGRGLEGLGRRIRPAARACANSFERTTPVATPDGPVAIADIEVGDEVLAEDPTTGVVAGRAVTARLVNEDPVTGTVTIDGESVETTPEHPFYTTERGWVAAKDLAVGDHIRSADRTNGLVESVSWTGGPATMYDLTVEVDHTFFVGDGRWLVHNCGGASWDAGASRWRDTETGRFVGGEVVQRAMSVAELLATEATGLLRGGRPGTHFVSDAVNTNARRARLRLALPTAPQVIARLHVPRGVFSRPRVVRPNNGMPGGGLERMGSGRVPVRVVGRAFYD